MIFCNSVARLEVNERTLSGYDYILITAIYTRKVDIIRELLIFGEKLFSAESQKKFEFCCRNDQRYLQLQEIRLHTPAEIFK